jgi:hypothetical protein
MSTLKVQDNESMELKIRRPKRTVNMSAEGGWCPKVKKPNIALVHTHMQKEN